jgi:alkylhydroperoxidase family enzyme
MQPIKQNSNSAFIAPPVKIPFFLRIGISISRKVTGKDLLVPKLLAWYPKVAISSGIMEALVAHGEKDLGRRILKLVRIRTSLTVSCPFCIDMNSFGYKEDGISDLEMDALAGKIPLDTVKSFSEKEIIVLEYVNKLCGTPIIMPSDVSQRMIRNFSEREVVILASTVAQVNYWARLIQGLGVPPEGFMAQCDLKTTETAEMSDSYR